VAVRRSAGILVYRRAADREVEVLIGHMGGPFWAGREAGAWSVPKGEHGPDQDPVTAARREFAEELGVAVPAGELVDLGTVRQAGGKQVSVWAVEGDLDPATAVSNTFSLEWPRGSGRLQEFPELDRLAWVPIAEASRLLVRAQTEFLDRLLEALGSQDAQH
jgi:predicted NUDIX family NTP pyrophosphohydrolase